LRGLLERVNPHPFARIRLALCQASSPDDRVALEAGSSTGIVSATCLGMASWKATWVWFGGVAIVALFTNCESSSGDDGATAGASITGEAGAAGVNEAGSGATPAGGSAGEAGAGGRGGSGNAPSSIGDGYAGDCGVPGAAGALPSDGEPPPATCYNAFSRICAPCCPTKTPDCSTLPDGYPGYDCTPAAGKHNDLSYCVCRCEQGEWGCSC
jgi:hypothetical protein